MKWEFTPDEFMHLWNETGTDRYPFPLRLLASVRWEDEFDRITRELRQRLPLGDDPDFSAALRVAAHPQTTLALIGTRRRPVRAYGAIDSDIGVTLVQRPGPEPAFGANVVIEVGSPGIVPKVFAAVLGNVPAGRHSPIFEDTERLRESLESWHGTKETAADRIRRLLNAPRSGAGTIECQRSLRDSPEPTTQYLNWFDIEDDGRYTYRRQYNEFHIIPCDQTTLTQELTHMIRPY
ncbi:ESX secretion-associated protein EspG [Nocardia callitridis]|uniref:ESX secretion-associated protein EspG n=1 Tax=Nocardia callitridis TaxID=648753 RepID=A0ABP9JTS2_9NOCA